MVTMRVMLLGGFGVLLVLTSGCQSFPFAPAPKAAATAPVAEQEAIPAEPEQARGDLPRLMLQRKEGAGSVLEFAPVSLALSDSNTAAPEPPEPPAPPKEATPAPEKTAAPEPQAAPAPTPPPAEPVAAPPIEQSGKLCPGDVLDVQCFSDPSLSRERTVRLDGCVSLPIVQDVVVAGLTPQAAEDRIKKAYRSTFRDPQLSVTLSSTVRRACTVLGDVAVPGRYPSAEATTLGQAIERAGGLRVALPANASSGWMHKALVIRAVDQEGAQQALCFGLEQAASRNAKVYPGDLVLIGDPTPLVYVIDGTNDSAAVECRDNTVVSELLASCGALRPERGALRGVEVWRASADKLQVAATIVAADLLSGANLPALQSGDVVRVLRKGTPATALESPRVEELSRRAAEAYYTKGLGVEGFAWLRGESGETQPEATGQLKPSMRNLMKLLSGNP